MRKANVKSIDVIPEFRAALIVFQNRVLDSLSTMQEEVFRALEARLLTFHVPRPG